MTKKTKAHWSEIRVWDKQSVITVNVGEDRLRAYLKEYQEHGYIESDYCLVVMKGDRISFIEGEDWSVDGIDWTGFEE